ncbi:MAG: hydratase [Pseudomonadota bacterium]
MSLEADECAIEVLNAFDTVESIAPFTDRDADLSLDQAYHIAAAIRRQRKDRGETHVGRKIGFTNRTIWPIYGVDAPIWGDMWDRTVFDAAETAEFSLDGLIEPRIEPEIVVALDRVPAPGMDDAALLDCCLWIAHGFELVQSPFPGWKFRTPDTICAGGLHGALVIGARRSVDEGALAAIGKFTCALSCDGTALETGRASNVLGSPLRALGHLVDLVAADASAPPLRSGEIITTGTLTDAYPIAAGQHWETMLNGIDLPGLSVSFV